MSEIALSQIEKSVEDLPTADQLLLISRVAERLRREAQNDFEFDADLAEMAADEQVQAEMRRIEHDFSVTELDGLSS
jgi:hypothetical protein